MSLFMHSNGCFYPTAESDFTNAIPVGTYTVGHDPNRGWFLKSITDFTVNHKIYGKTSQWADRIISTFQNRPNTTGVLLDGEKGSGKTLLSKLISVKCAELDMPTLIINAPLQGDSFNSFIQSIKQSCVIIFDEFEKVFNTEELQNGVLTLLDGVYPTKKLFILTSNDKYRVNQHMINRPGRIFYFIEYKGLDNSFIQEYCEDNLLNWEHIPQIKKVAAMFSSFNFDLLKALVEEMNRYGETAHEALELLNAKPADSNRSAMYDVELAVDGVPATVRTSTDANPLLRHSNTFTVYLGECKGKEDKQTETLFTGMSVLETDDGETYVIVEFGQADLRSVDPMTNTIVYAKVVDGKVITATAVRRKNETHDWRQSLTY